MTVQLLHPRKRSATQFHDCDRPRLRYETMQRDELLARHHAEILQVVSFLERGEPLEPDQRDKIVKLIEEEIPAPRYESRLSVTLLMYRTSRIPADKLKNPLTGQQWDVWKGRLEVYQDNARYEELLKQVQSEQGQEPEKPQAAMGSRRSPELGAS